MLFGCDARRHDPKFRVSGIPTLVRWGAGAEGGGRVLARVDSELEKASTEEEAKAVVKKFVEASKDLAL